MHRARILTVPSYGMLLWWKETDGKYFGTNICHRIYTHNTYPNKTVFPQPATSQTLQCTQLTPKTASVVPPEDERLTPETCRGSRHNKVIVKVKVY
jgi:hypothetical protein